MKRKAYPHLELKDEDAVDLLFERMAPEERQNLYDDIVIDGKLVNIQNIRTDDMVRIKKYLKTPIKNPSVHYERHKILAKIAKEILK